MRTFPNDWHIPGMAKWLLAQASLGVMDMNNGSRANQVYSLRCRGWHAASGVSVLLTRDTGHHSCGWWKNPDYERCIHLSLSFRDPETFTPRERDQDVSAEWVAAVFPGMTNLVWAEPPYSDVGKQGDIWHYRVFFADHAFRIPILPRGEVYSKEFTEAGWKSWSDVEADRAAKQARIAEILGNTKGMEVARA